MATLFLIDQSLTAVGGHHYDYARLTAQAAEGMGLVPVLGTHRKFPERSALNAFGTVRRVFRRTTYSRYSVLAGLEEITRGDHSYWESLTATGSGWLDKQVRRFRHGSLVRRRGGLVRQFAEDCERFFGDSSFNEGDHALFCTLSELEFMGLAAYLANHPRSMQVTWHAQFHFGLLAGRPPEYDQQQSRLRTVAECFAAALARVPYHEIRFHTTSDELAEQYNRMRLGRFHCLPYPIDRRLSASEPSAPEKRPLVLTCAGGARREKGKFHLADLISDAWDELLDGGTLRMNVQCSNLRWLKLRDKAALTRRQDSQAFAQAVRFVEHPLNDQAYLDFIRESDIGLMYYDSRRYYCRRAGVLGEFLLAGKPVIVPAGSWLSHQIAEPSFQHVEQTIRDAIEVQTQTLDLTRWENTNVPLPGGIVSFDQEKNPFLCTLEVEPQQSVLAICFDWHWPAAAGGYCRLKATCCNQKDAAIQEGTQVVGFRVLGGSPHLLFNLAPGTRKVRLRFSNAYSEVNFSIRNLRFHLLSMETRETVPLGAVGVSVPDPEQLLTAVKEVVEHYKHYGASAARFAVSWAAAHQSERTIAQLLKESSTVGARAA